MLPPDRELAIVDLELEVLAAAVGARIEDQHGILRPRGRARVDGCAGLGAQGGRDPQEEQSGESRQGAHRPGTIGPARAAGKLPMLSRLASGAHRLAEIHATAIVEGDVELAPDAVVGPWCRLRGPISIGSGTRLLASVHLEGPLRLGARNLLFPFATLGLAPQDLGWDPDEPGAGLVIGDDNVFRESVTIHRATSRDEPTRIGDGNYWMVNCHAGHDCRIGSSCVFANGTLLAGHVEVGDRVVTGGNVAVHQHCRIGRGALLSGTWA